jgi:hypothetical protein
MGPELTILLEPYAAVYIEIPKVACSSIKVAISELLELELDGPNKDPHRSTLPVAQSPMQKTQGWISLTLRLCWRR